jgi:hypothetical protein
MSAVDLGEEVKNSVITVQEIPQDDGEYIEYENKKPRGPPKEDTPLPVCQPPKRGKYKPITGQDYIQLERLQEFGNFPDRYMRQLRAYIMRGYTFKQAQELLKVV